MVMRPGKSQGCVGQVCSISLEEVYAHDNKAIKYYYIYWWLNMRSGELREQDLEQGSQQRFPSSSHVVHKLKEAQIQWQVVL